MREPKLDPKAADLLGFSRHTLGAGQTRSADDGARDAPRKLVRRDRAAEAARTCGRIGEDFIDGCSDVTVHAVVSCIQVDRRPMATDPIRKPDYPDISAAAMQQLDFAARTCTPPRKVITPSVSMSCSA